MRQLKIKLPKSSNDNDDWIMTDRNIIKLTGSATLWVRPNIIIVTLEIGEILPTNQEAYSKGKEHLNHITEVLLEHDIEKSKATNTLFIVKEDTESVYKNGKCIGYKKNGFKLWQRINLSLPYDNTLINTIVEEIQKRIPNVETGFESHLTDKLRDHKLKAMELAVKDAREKAEILVATLGARLGEIVRINYMDEESYYCQRSEPTEKYLQDIGYSENDNLELSMKDQRIKEEVEIMWEVINP